MDMKKYINPTIAQLPPSGIRKFFDLVSQSNGIISLGVGEPDFVTPWNIRETAWYSLTRGYTMYSPNRGLLELRELIAEYEQNSIGVTYQPENDILVTVGASEAVDLAFRALIEPGDEVLIPEPSYVAYAPGVAMAYGVPVPVATFDEDEYRLKPEQLAAKITPKSKILVLSYPNNPTGGIMNQEDLQALCDLIQKNDLLVISDEIYSELTYEGKHVSIASLPGMKERTIVVNGFSKAFAMTGWRIGYACGNSDLIGAMNKIHQYAILCAPIMAQKAAIEALRHGRDEMKAMVEDYNARRLLIVNGMREIGLSCFEPRGAFYCFPSIRTTGLSSEEFCTRLVQEAKVAAIPGTAFGESGEGFIRCCYAASVTNIETALERIEQFLTKL